MSLELQLKILAGGSPGQLIRIAGPKFFIGRAEDCHLRPGSDLISRHHCVILLEGESVVVRDFASKNGTYVNDERIVGECELTHGNRVKIGPLEFEVQLDQKLTAPKRSKVNSVEEAAARTAETAEASATTTEEDMVGDWLNEEAKDVGDTREIQRHETATFGMGDTMMSPMPKPSEAEPAEAPPAEEKKPAPKKILGKSTETKKSGESSHNAAADMLKRLKRRS